MLTTNEIPPNGSNKSFRSVRSFLSSFNQATVPKAFVLENRTRSLETVHLPPSIKSNLQISPKLWSWMHLSENTDGYAMRKQAVLERANLTRLYSYKCETLNVPHHLLCLPQKRMSSGDLNSRSRFLIFLAHAIAESQLKKFLLMIFLPTASP
jgi:hypothetical protein